MTSPHSLPLAPGPVAVVLNEDDVALDATVEHFKALMFQNIVVLGQHECRIADVHTLKVDVQHGLAACLNPLIDAWAGRWICWCYNSEFFYFPFCETRAVQDLLQFVTEERREAVFGTVVDLYGQDLAAESQGIDLDAPFFDASGYFARARYDGPDPLERQIHVHGGLKRRYSEHVPWERQPIERIAAIRARPGRRINDVGVLSEPELNTVSTKWHNSLTLSIASYRVAKSLLSNPGSAEVIDSFMWSGSRPFAWNSEHLMTLGLMEPGQWF